ncbi:hypothetical protein CJ030_MR6G016567 [Morella rubra]|uniref:Uncharacterized protein n=1 Tax=Morella rubra TaxID=262757 RepID=A0A6A1VE00_9ROSI|nr:hypothetical protein CJ030_MR6G016567 [Morella rubra]
MGYTNYKRISGQRRRPWRGFRLQKKRFSVLRVRFLYFLGFYRRWKFSCGEALRSLLKKGIRRKRNIINSKINQNCSQEGMESCSWRAYNPSSSFYSEAISDCLEFIKLSAVAVDGNSVADRN